jgi:hypothetical protein
MPRREISTVLDEHLFRRAKLESIRQRRQVSEILGQALEEYLGHKARGRATTGVVAETWRALKVRRRALERILRETGDLLDS